MNSFSYAIVILVDDGLISCLLSFFLLFVNQFLAAEAVEANSIFGDLQGTLSTHQGEMAHFARDLRQV